MACASLCLGAAGAQMPIAGAGVPSLSVSTSRRASGRSRVRMAATLPPIPPLNPKDPFLSKLSSIAASSPDILSHISSNSDIPPFLDLFDSPTLMATPAQVSYWSYFVDSFFALLFWSDLVFFVGCFVLLMDGRGIIVFFWLEGMDSNPNI